MKFAKRVDLKGLKINNKRKKTKEEKRKEEREKEGKKEMVTMRGDGYAM